jgi:hypothetical protein
VEYFQLEPGKHIRLKSNLMASRETNESISDPTCP